MPLKLSNETNKEGKWFTYATDIELKIRPILGTSIREIELSAQTGRQVVDPRTRKMVPEIDEKKRDELLTDYIIEDWRGVVDDDDKPVPVTLENKKALLNLVQISDFVWESARSLDMIVERQKNSEMP
jgi:hypothetical protein